MGSFQWEVDFIAALQYKADETLIWIMSAFSMLGEEMALVVIVGLLYLCYDKKMGRKLALGMLGGILGGEIIKSRVLRLRPYFSHSGILCLRAPSGGGDIMDLAVQGYSFPSMHSSNSVIMFGLLAVNSRKRWCRVIWLVFPLLIGFSRAFLGVHYPTDVMAGWLFGAIVLYAVLELTERTENYLLICAVSCVLALPGWLICGTKDFSSAYGLMVGMLLGFAFEDKLVRFENTASFLRGAVRLISGLVLFFGLSSMLKMLLPENQIFRALRYALSSFAVMGVYPMVFKPMNRIWKSVK